MFTSLLVKTTSWENTEYCYTVVPYSVFPMQWIRNFRKRLGLYFQVKLSFRHQLLLIALRANGDIV